MTDDDRAAAAKALGYRDWEDAMDYRQPGARITEAENLATAFQRNREVAIKAERTVIATWMRRQSDLGANRGNEADKGTTKRAAYGGGSLALSRAAATIESGEYVSNDNEPLRDVLTRVRDMADYLASDANDAAWPAQLDRPGTMTRRETARDLAALVDHVETPRRDPVMAALASLRAAISLLEKGGKKAAPSDMMFEQMLRDYHRAADNLAETILEDRNL